MGNLPRSSYFDCPLVVAGSRHTKGATRVKGYNSLSNHPLPLPQPSAPYPVDRMASASRPIIVAVSLAGAEIAVKIAIVVASVFTREHAVMTAPASVSEGKQIIFARDS